MQNKKMVLISIIVLIAIFISGGIYYKNSQSEKMIAMAKEQALLFQRPHSLVIGNEHAKVQLVEFFDPACETCAIFHPKVKAFMKENEGKIKVCKVNVDEEPDLAEKFGVMSIPTFVAIKNGKVLGTSIGVQDEEEILKMFDK